MMEDKILRGYSILGAISAERAMFDQPIQSALVAVKCYPRTRVFLGCAYGHNEDDIYGRVARMGDEISFEFIERLYRMMKAEREEEK